MSRNLGGGDRGKGIPRPEQTTVDSGVVRDDAWASDTILDVVRPFGAYLICEYRIVGPGDRGGNARARIQPLNTCRQRVWRVCQEEYSR